MKSAKGITIFLAVMTGFMFFFSISSLLTFIRMITKGEEITAKVIFANGVGNPDHDPIFKMEILDKNGHTTTKFYEHGSNRKFKINQIVKMRINYDNYSDFWYVGDLNFQFFMTWFVQIGLLVLTCLTWRYKNRIQSMIDRGEITFGD